MKALYIITLLILTATPSFSKVLEFTAAANHTNYQESEITKSGISVRFKFRPSNARITWQIAGNLAGGGILSGEYIFAYGVKTPGPTYFEAAAGLRFSQVWGLGPAAILSVGTELGRGWHLSLPLIYKPGFSIELTPYLGFNF